MVALSGAPRGDSGCGISMALFALKDSRSLDPINPNIQQFRNIDMVDLGLQKCDPDFYQSRLILVDLQMQNQIW